MLYWILVLNKLGIIILRVFFYHKKLFKATGDWNSS